MLRCLFYTSLLASGESPATVTDIVRAARYKNRLQGVTGVLVFDGLALAQYLEGPPGVLAELRELLSRDRRHSGFHVRLDIEFAGPRFFPGWSLAFGICTDPEAFQRFEGREGNAAFDLFRSMLPEFDVEA
ncbi:BLUF domain-containing protein [Niveibacterium sp. SC-1]|uniref:BLUF domain-containing protein n=1 Tax=Niveibacterium sp. SC-1 TaxID=3135646 RepID=UPI00311F9C13